MRVGAVIQILLIILLPTPCFLMAAAARQMIAGDRGAGGMATNLARAAGADGGRSGLRSERAIDRVHGTGYETRFRPR